MAIWSLCKPVSFSKRPESTKFQPSSLKSSTEIGSSRSNDENSNNINIGPDHIKICHINIRSLRKKLDNLFVLLNSIDFPEVIICITETPCSADEINLIILQGYTLADSFSRSVFKGGRTAIFVRDDICFSLKSLKCARSDKQFEYALCEISIEKESFLIGSFYRSPQADINFFINYLNFLCDKVLKGSDKVFFCGDFNANFDDINNKNALKIVNLMASYNLHKTIFEYTRVINGSKTTIDNIFTNMDRSAASTGGNLCGSF